MMSWIDGHAWAGPWAFALQLAAPALLLAWAAPGWRSAFALLGAVSAIGLALAAGMVVNLLAFLLLAAIGLGPVAPPLAVLAAAGGVAALALAWAARRRGMPEPRTGDGSAVDGRASPGWWQLIALLAAAVAAGLAAGPLLRDQPGVFWTWDAVLSWNRWATEWAAGGPPIYTMGYPQAIPTLLAGMYTWMGSVRVEPAARMLLLVFPLGTLALMLDAFRRSRDASFLLGSGTWLLALAWMFPTLADSGYADVPVAFFVVLTAYLLWRGVDGGLPARVAVPAAALAAAAAVLTKQPGGLAWLLWLAALAWPGRLRWLAGCALLWLLLAGAWYGYFAWTVQQGRDVSNLGVLVTTNHEDRTLAQRLAFALDGPLHHALAGVGPPGVVAAVLVGLLALACLDRLGRVLVLGLVAPWLLLWLFGFSYDLRNLMPVVPLACVALGLGATQLARAVDRVMQSASSRGGSWWHRLQLASPARQEVREHCGHRERWERWIPWDRRDRRDRPPRLVRAAVVLALLLPPLWPWPLQRVEALHRELQLDNQDRALNEWLVARAGQGGFDGLVLTTYTPMLMLDELKVHVPSHKLNPIAGRELTEALHGGRDWCVMQGLMPPHLRTLRHLLLHEPILKPVIDRALADGSLELVFAHGGVRFMTIRCRALVPG